MARPGMVQSSTQQHAKSSDTGEKMPPPGETERLLEPHIHADGQKARGEHQQ